MTFSRSGLLSLVVVAVLLGLKWRSAPVLLMTVVLVAASVAFTAYYWTRGEDFQGLGSDLNFQQRLATSRAAVAMFADHPLTGVGLGCSLVAWPLYAPATLYTRNWLITHNTFLQALSETGILGFAAFMGLLIAALLRARSRSRLFALGDSRRRLGSALEVSLLGFMFSSLSGGWMLTWFPYILIALVSSAHTAARYELPRTAPC